MDDEFPLLNVKIKKKDEVKEEEEQHETDPELKAKLSKDVEHTDNLEDEEKSKPDDEKKIDDGVKPEEKVKSVEPELDNKLKLEADIETFEKPSAPEPRPYKNKKIQNVTLLDIVAYDKTLGDALELKKPKKKKKSGQAKPIVVTSPSKPTKVFNTATKPTFLKKSIEKDSVVKNVYPSSLRIIDPILDDVIISLLKALKEKQDKLHEENPTKAFSKRKLICGLHETLKHFKIGNIKAVLIANNIDEELLLGPTSSQLFQSLRSGCISQSIPFIYCCSKKLLSRILHKFPYTVCIGMMSYGGYEHQFRNMVSTWMKSHSYIDYHTEQSSLIP